METRRRVYGLERAALQFNNEEIIQIGRKRDEMIEELQEIIRAPSDDTTDRVFTEEIKDVLIDGGNMGKQDGGRRSKKMRATI